ncbi:MAG: helix-turn-helix domain-containing protein, partial [Acutalibacteraceae bacterium]
MFSERLRELRKSKKMTQSDLAGLLGISASSVGMYEQGRRNPDNEMLGKITEYFGVSTDFLLGKERKDVGIFLEDFRAMLGADEGLMFNGVPLSREDAQKVLN